MNPSTIQKRIAFFAAIVCMTMFLTVSAMANPVRWITNPEEAALVRQQRQKPSLVFFHNQQARPARQMQDETLTNDRVLVRLQNFVCVSLDQQAHHALAREYGLVKVPTVIFLDSSGREIDRAIGFKPVDAFIQYLDRITSAYESREAGAMIAPFAGAAIDILSATSGTTAINLAFYAAEARTVHVVGDFNDWRTDATPLNRAGNGFWNITLHLAGGVYEYMFLVDGGTYVADASNVNKKPNPYGGHNSVLLVGNPRVSPTVVGNSVIFRTYQPTAHEVSVAGSFNDWRPFTMFRNDRDPGEWGIRYDNIPPGTYQYKFIIDGVWSLDPENYMAEPDTNGTLNNAFVIR